MLLLEPLHTKFHPRPTYQESNQQRIEQITSIRISALVSVVLVNDAALVLLSSSMSIIVRWLRKRCQSSDGLSYRFAAGCHRSSTALRDSDNDEDDDNSNSSSVRSCGGGGNNVVGGRCSIILDPRTIIDPRGSGPAAAVSE